MRFYLVHQRLATLVEDLGPGDLWFAPPGVPHAIQGLEEGTAFVLIFNDGDFSDNGTLLATERAAPMSRLVLAKSFGVPESAFEGIPPSEKHIFRLPVPGPIEEVRKQFGAGAAPGARTRRHGLSRAGRWPQLSPRVRPGSRTRRSGSFFVPAPGSFQAGTYHA